MKLYLLSCAIFLLMVGITLVGNSLKVTGQSDSEESQDILSTAANATANATGELMSRSDKVLSLASDAASIATRTAINNTMNLLSNVSNNVNDAGLNTSSNLRQPISATTNRQLNETSQTYTYENATLGISFQYPSNWREMTSDIQLNPLQSVSFFVTVPKLDTVNITSNANQWNTSSTISSNVSQCDGNEPMEIFDVILLELQKCDSFKMNIVPFGLDDPNLSEPCLCSTLMEFVKWDYDRAGMDKRTFIGDNQTTIGNNYTAWQMESVLTSTKNKVLDVWAINENLGYSFIYSGPADDRFDQYLDGFKNMLKTVKFTSPIPEKKPSFLNSSNLSNSPSSATQQSEPVKILSSNDYIDSIGYLHVVGEVENRTPANIQFVKVTGTFYDSNNQVVATDFTYTNPRDIGPGQKAPFELILSSASIPITQIDEYNLIVSYQ